MSPLQTNSASATQQLVETGFRRRIKAEVNELTELFSNTELNDELTVSLKEWHQDYLKLISHQNIEKVRDKFILLLQELLVDSLLQAPLDEEALLGSDGKAYGKKSLSVFLSLLPKELHHKNPHDSENPAPFITSPHPIARGVVHWMKRHHYTLAVSETIESSYTQLIQEQKLPTIPTKQTERIRLIRNRFENTRQSVTERITQVTVEFNRTTENRFAAIREEMEAQSHRNLQLLDEIAQRQDEDLRNIRQNIENLSEEVKKLNDSTQDLKDSIDKNNEDLQQLYQEDASLSLSILKTRQAIINRKKRWVKRLINLAATVAVCAVVTLACPAALAAVPINGGAKVTFTVLL